jgi:ubiquinone/menaquinone biosynthesis C-methylase UbiE
MSDLGRDFDAYQAFVLGAKLHWTRQLYPRLKERCARTVERAEVEVTTAEQVDGLMQGDVDYAYYAWFERHLQRLKYSGRRGLVPAHEPQRQQLEAWLDTPVPEGLLSLDEQLELPKYFTSVDIHQHPGGVCGDPLAGVVYERGARTTTPLARKDLDLHYRLVSQIAEHITPTRVVDLGCGFGKTTRPLYQEFTDAMVTAVDISAPCLKLAARLAADEHAGNVEFLQRRAEATGLKSAKFDLVTSTMLLHEMPPAAVTAVVEESARLLSQGGYAIHLDFLANDDAIDRFVHYGHSRRNNEPYMRPLNEMDLYQVHHDAGFSEVEILPFEEAPGALSSDNKNWRFPWAVVVARK